MHNRLRLGLALFILFGVVLAGCAQPTPEPTFVPTRRAPTRTPTSEPTSTSAPTVTPLPTSAPTGAPTPIPTAIQATATLADPACMKVAFVADVTVPDNTKFDKGAAFIKTWRVKNSGTCDWFADTALVFLSGHKLDAAQTSLPVGVVKVGETKDISVNLKAPNEDAANLVGRWQLQSGGKALGGSPTVSVVIVAGNPATPVTAGAPTAAAAAPTSAPSAPSAQPVAPPSSGPTMYGVQAHWAAVYSDEARLTRTAARIAELGVGWTKLQVRWGSDDYYYDCSGNFSFDWNHTNQVINSAGARGLRVLFSVVTSPPCTHPGNGDVEVPPDDPNVFAAFVGELASRYAGRGIAIEIWERQNATPGLDAGRYTRMLAAAYNRIKAIDPGIIVVGGAPAPYVSGGDTEALTYLQQMKAAGADKYMDCVGVYFNDSTASPAGGYFEGILRGYQSRMNKQACVTSFGVASEQGVGHIAGVDLFKNNTDTHQAEWTTQAMALARQAGARMIILFNLDYGPLSGMTPNALFSFYTPNDYARPVNDAVKNWCAANGCK